MTTNPFGIASHLDTIPNDRSHLLVTQQIATNAFSRFTSLSSQATEMSSICAPRQPLSFLQNMSNHGTALAASTASAFIRLNSEEVTATRLKSEQLPLTELAQHYVVGPMSSLESSLDYYFNEIWIKNGDERTSKLPFLSGTPWRLVYATILYLCAIKLLLPKLMSSRGALELNWCLRIYNLAMVLSNIYAFYHGARILQFGLKCFGCQLTNHCDYSPESIELIHYGWLFLISRIIEWLDTIFFVLRKKEQQVTKLHVFHHSFVPILCWFYLKFHPAYTVAFFPFVNTFVHSIMYTYYFLATFGQRTQPYLWWKKYLTSLQILQFVLILIQLASIPISSNDRCQYPRVFLYIAFAGAILFLFLFYTYYVDTYKASPPKLASQSNPRQTVQARVSLESQRRSLMSSLVSSNEMIPKPVLKSILNSVLSKQREGTSRSLADSIENALIGVADLMPIEYRKQHSRMVLESINHNKIA